jgi:hypothetical protein
VDETTAPRSRETSQRKPRSLAPTATSPAVAATPAVASAAAGQTTARNEESGVLRPPSKRIRTSAAVPARKARP